MGKIIDFLDDHTWFLDWALVILAFSSFYMFLNTKLAQLYEVQAEIVIHDYGHIFQTIEDWKLEKIEKYYKNKGDKNETETKTY